MSYLRFINSVLKITLFSNDFYCTKVSGRIFYMVLLNVLRYRKFGNKTLILIQPWVFRVYAFQQNI